MTLLLSLRGRLAGAMVVVFILAVIVSSLADRFAETLQHGLAGLQFLNIEPYQDALVLAAFSLPALAVIWWVISWSLAPVARASHEARLIGPQNTKARLSRDGMPAEITPLVDAVNSALERLSDAVDAERRFTENAAHELRTPLAVLGLSLQRARLSHAPNGIDWGAIDTDLRQMNRLVAQLMDLARKDNASRTGGAQPSVALNLSRIARETCAMMLPMIEAEGRALCVELADEVPVRGRADDLHDALRNLLENAVLHGKGCITVTGRLQSTEACLIVADEGPGLPDSAQESVFERFHTAGGSGGSGLGLAIVREVARSHGGQVAFLAGSPCRVALTLPAAQQL
jgi:signal transduction histidine kinase